YFDKVDDGYQVVKSIRDMVIFAQQNMVKDPPFTKIDLLICRNLLIYLTPEIQKKLMPLFHYSLNQGGFLYLGSAESVGNFTELFKPLNIKSRIYQRLHPLNYKEHIELPATFSPPKSEAIQPMNESQNMQAIADKMILQYYSPSTVFVNSKGEILYITGKVGKYLEPPTGRVNWNVFAMAREGLNNKLSDAFYKALQEEQVVTYKNAVVLNEGGPLMVDITVSPLKESGALCGVIMIIFTDVQTANVDEKIGKNGITSANHREQELEGELLQIRNMWQVAGAEMQQSQEEFKSNNEELQSCNEELQSTNEELTTTKEEIQASNEELKTINSELQAKLDELSLATKDMKNRMDSTEIATIFLDNNLLVKHFTSQMSIITRLISSDVDRPITDIASDLIYPELSEDVRNVLATLIPIEKQVVSRNANWFNVRILPYHTLENKLDGVVITFINIMNSKM
ncbi:MAG TPA: PAS domain-containing protein, partial [Patescibacteria group bacterium]|nr:PAS domain-containing protein [Patescibacteria group bacterium]